MKEQDSGQKLDGIYVYLVDKEGNFNIEEKALDTDTQVAPNSKKNTMESKEIAVHQRKNTQTNVGSSLLGQIMPPDGSNNVS